MTNRPLVEIVSHCWNYSNMWTYQMSSLLLHPPERCDVLMTIFFCKEEDDRTWKRINDFCRWGLIGSDISTSWGDFDGDRNTFIHTRGNWPSNIALSPWNVDTGSLFRRAIGRNMAALTTKADLVWFADCDMVMGEGGLDFLVKYHQENKDDDKAKLLVPQSAMWSEQEKGDELAAAVEHWNWQDGPVDIDTSEDFVLRRYSRAIGGVQIADGQVCRLHGYIPRSTRYQKTEKQWKRTKEDPHYRKQLDRIYKTGTGRKIDMPNISRIRHTERGREKEGHQL